MRERGKTRESAGRDGVRGTYSGRDRDRDRDRDRGRDSRDSDRDRDSRDREAMRGRER